MKVKITTPDGKITRGTFVGLVNNDDFGIGVIVRRDGFGLYCDVYHPSRVVPIDSEEKP